MHKIFSYYYNLVVSNKQWLKAITTLFFIAVLGGVGVGLIYSGLIEYIANIFADKFGANPNLDLNLALQIFIQNLVAALIASFGGIILSIIPILTVSTNGFLIGYIITIIIKMDEKIPDVLLTVLPHAIIELPVIIFAAALGAKLGMNWLQKNPKRPDLQVLKTDILNIVYSTPLMAILLLIAALIEVFISGSFT